ncbi:hypothetical protein WUBG_17784, partial [Wuchereria bancrofti]
KLSCEENQYLFIYLFLIICISTLCSLLNLWKVQYITHSSIMRLINSGRNLHVHGILDFS